MQKISKKHYWLRQIRRPLCLALIVLIVFCHGLIVEAAIADTQKDSISNIYNVDEFTTPLLWQTMRENYISKGNDVTKLNNYNGSGGLNYPASNSSLFSGGQIYSGVLDTIKNNTPSVNIVNNFKYNEIEYDLSNCYTILYIGGNSGLVYPYAYTRIKSLNNDKIVIVDGKITSKSPFIKVSLSGQNSDNDNNPYIENVNNIDSNGLYSTNLNDIWVRTNYEMLAFNDLDIYFSSMDGSSGFTLNNFDFDNIDNYFNFNYYKTEGIIVNETEKEEILDLSIGQHYTYANVSGSFAPSSNTSLGTHLSINANEYMRTHPEEYKVNLDYYVIPFITDGNHYFQCHHEYSLSSLIGGGHYQVPDGSFSDSVDFNHLIWRTEQTTLSQHIIESYRSKYPSSSNNMSVSDVFRNIFNWDVTSSSSGKEINGVILGNWTMNPLLSNWFASMQAGLTVTITWIGGDPEFTSGEITFTYKTGEGTKITKNTISNNLNPPEVYDPQYPAQITDGNGNTIVNGTPVNTYLYNNLQATIEHLFNIDASDINNIGGNMHNMYQGLVTELSNTSQSGFWGVLKQTYTFIPDEIWDWIKIVVGFLLGGTVVGWAYNGWRIKGR